MADKQIIVSPVNKKKYYDKLLAIGDGEIGRDLMHHIRSRYRMLYVCGYEENRIIKAFKLIAQADGYDLCQWDYNRGMLDAFSLEKVASENNEIHSNPEAALHYILNQARADNETLDEESTKKTGGHIYLLLDFHYHIDPRLGAKPKIERLFKEFANLRSVSHIVIISPVFVCPVTLEKEMAVIDFPPPSRAEVKVYYDRMRDKIPIKYPKAIKMAKENEEDILAATTGLTIMEAENAYAKSLVKTKTFDISVILEEKKQIIRKGGILEYRDSRFTFDQVGGLGSLKDWLHLRRLGFRQDAREFGLAPPKGVLLIGIPGCVLGDTKIRIKKISNEGEHQFFVNGVEQSIRVEIDEITETTASEEQEITIEEFFVLCKGGGTYQIDTPDGWKDILSLIQKDNKPCYNLIFDNGAELGCSEDHLVLTNDLGWVSAKDLDANKHMVLTCDGVVGVAVKEFIGERNTFDLEVDSDEHRYYTNGVISHNTGKSMVSDALANFYEMPLLRLDVGALFSSLIGDSERNTRDAIRTIESISPAILWIDEIEKGIGGVQSSNHTDGGVTNRVFGTLLTWMQEKEVPVFVIATANNLDGIPPEFQRAGRFDEIFFLDLPDQDQRVEVISCLLNKKKYDPSEFDLKKISIVSKNYSPAELEKGIDNAMFVAFADGGRDITTEDIISEINKFQPLYNSRREELEAMRTWALGEKGEGGRARLANSVRSTSYSTKDTGRQISFSEDDL